MKIPNPPFDEPETYTFQTEGEKDAFIRGIHDCLGWQDFEIIPND